jgi:hypothetical protein
VKLLSYRIVSSPNDFRFIISVKVDVEGAVKYGSIEVSSTFECADTLHDPVDRRRYVESLLPKMALE